MGVSSIEGFSELALREQQETNQRGKLRTRVIAGGLVLATAVSLTACSGDDDGESSASTTLRPTTSEQETTTSTTAEASTSTVTTSLPNTPTTLRSSPPVTVGEKCAETKNWNTQPESNFDMTYHEYMGISIGRHACFDRITFVMNGGEPVAGYYAGYTDGSEVTSLGEGKPVPTDGPAAMEVVIRAPAQGVNPNLEKQTGLPSVPNVGETILPEDEFDYHGIENIKEVAYTGSQHGDLGFAIGLTEEHDFRVDSFAADDGSRHVVYIDIER